MPLALTVLAVLLAFFQTAPPPPAPISLLPPTLAGLSRDEGVFLVSAADDGSRVVFFVAQNSRHAILDADLQIEQQLNLLWPVRAVTREEALAYPEGAPVGEARAGLLRAPSPEVDVAEAPAEPVVAAEPTVAVAEPVAEAQPAIAEPVAELQPVLAEVGPTTYVLRPGDNLTYISRDHGTTVAAILEANGLANANRIYAGQSLIIPGTAAPTLLAEAPAPQEPEPAPAPVAASEPVVGNQSSIYVLRPGDNLTHISRDHGTTVAAILEANGLANANRIYAGQSLVIPGTPAPTLLAEAPAPQEPAAPASVPVDEPALAVTPEEQTAETATYTVKRGDSAIGIARRLGVDVDMMLALNGVSDRNRIYADQILTIPG